MFEARTLARFHRVNIVRVYTVFEEHGTAYMVMEYERGHSLARAVRLGEIVGESDLLGVALPLLEGLSLVHQAGFIHRDIKPDNVFLRAENAPVLLDFGSARQTVDTRSQSLTSFVTPGFSPIEQYNASGDDGRQGPWTDIYAFGATLYRMIVGRGPTDAVSRANTLLNEGRDAYFPLCEIQPTGYTPEILEAIDHALAFHPAERPQSVEEWTRVLPERAGDAATGSASRESANVIDLERCRPARDLSA